MGEQWSKHNWRCRTKVVLTSFSHSNKATDALLWARNVSNQGEKQWAAGVLVRGGRLWAKNR